MAYTIDQIRQMYRYCSEIDQVLAFFGSGGQAFGKHAAFRNAVCMPMQQTGYWPGGYPTISSLHIPKSRGVRSGAAVYAKTPADNESSKRPVQIRKSVQFRSGVR